ncbi:glycoside hydrolase family 6 protein [Nonomuraea sp. MG754425]|uniref:glycoside hydrolase family 6 protein n=1 Tax=Nonomuraea sp. MG754425 TaxID=2570319 RepID=UPI001F027A40|nr:glycoside hydrolase family 6 protein [Nonomuraea sp. MG754425]
MGRYTLLGRLGEGGMGVVYLARDPSGARVAVKLIHARMDAHPGFRRRFAREVSAAGRVARFCTAPVLDADVEGEVAYLVTEYVEGPSLKEFVATSGPLRGSALDGLAASMAMALRAIHGAGVVHRDLKPSNVLLSPVGPKVIDFGIAWLADSEVSSTVLGTPAYMSPEQVSGAEAGPASDVFSWGCTVAFAASGVPPFGTGSVPTLLLRIVNDPPDLGDLPAPQEPGAARQAELWKTDRPRDAELMRRLARVPHAVRLNQPEVRSKVAATITAAEQAGGVPVFLISYLPGGECTPTSRSALPGYQEWIAGIAHQIGPARAVVVLEPSSLVRVPGTANCDRPGTPEQRYQDLRQAVRSLKANPATAVYLDGSQDFWPGAEIMAARLVGAGIDRADGFFVNTGGYQATAAAVEYGKALSACVGIMLKTGGTTCPKDAGVDPAAMPHFVVDTSRNGRGAWSPAKHYEDPQTWCNPPGRGVGDRPSTRTGEELVDAYLWISRAGTSNGRCRRGTTGEVDPEHGVVSPPSGEWWADLALERARNAVPPLG